MSKTKISHPPQFTEEDPKPYHQRPDESDRWYDRFLSFCQLGPNRGLTQCYRQFTAASASAEGLSAGGKRVPGAWARKFREYNWHDRAKAWDTDQRQLAFKNLQSTLNLVTEAAREALQFQIDLMRGWIKDPDGQPIPVLDIYQRRMASKTLLKWAIELQNLLQPDQDEKRTEVTITEIRAQEPDSLSA